MNLFSDYKNNDNLPFLLPSKDGYSINWNDSLNGFNIKEKCNYFQDGQIISLEYS